MHAYTPPARQRLPHCLYLKYQQEFFHPYLSMQPTNKENNSAMSFKGHKVQLIVHTRVTVYIRRHGHSYLNTLARFGQISEMVEERNN